MHIPLPALLVNLLHDAGEALVVLAGVAAEEIIERDGGINGIFRHLAFSRVGIHNSVGRRGGGGKGGDGWGADGGCRVTDRSGRGLPAAALKNLELGITNKDRILGAHSLKPIKAITELG